MNSMLQQKKITDCPVHSFCTIQGIHILKNDYPSLMSDYLDHALLILNKGNSWCDEGFNNIHHFYHPKTGKGILGLTGADSHLYMNIEKAKKAFKNSAYEDCFFYIGSALHLIQDLCVPHHALGHLLNGHREYESWVLENYLPFSVYDGGIYDFKDPIEILAHNGLAALQYSELVFDGSLHNKIEATRALLGLAQRTSASFLRLILQDIIPFDLFNFK